jgi:hypothetical protein
VVRRCARLKAGERSDEQLYCCTAGVAVAGHADDAGISHRPTRRRLRWRENSGSLSFRTRRRDLFFPPRGVAKPVTPLFVMLLFSQASQRVAACSMAAPSRAPGHVLALDRLLDDLRCRERHRGRVRWRRTAFRHRSRALRGGPPA